MTSFWKSRWTLFTTLVCIILIANTSVYRWEMVQPIPGWAVLGSIVDLLIVIPLLAYFLILRKKYSLKYLFLVVIAGYGAAWLIVPQGYFSSYEFVKYILFAGEAAFIVLELFVLFKVFSKLPERIKRFRSQSGEIPYFVPKLEKTFEHVLKTSRVARFVISDISILYYSLFSWKQKPILTQQTFTYHQNTSVVALNIMIIHALAIESIGVHLWLHSWNTALSTVLLILNIYTLLLLLAEIQAIRLCPFIITNQELYLQVGIMRRLTVDLSQIKNICYYEGPEEISKEEKKNIFNGVAADFVQEKPAIEITFVKPIESKMPFGFTQKVEKAHLRPDNPKNFYEVLNKKVNRD